MIDADGSDNVLLTSEARHGQPVTGRTKILYTTGIREDLGFAVFTIAPDGTGASLFPGGREGSGLVAGWDDDRLRLGADRQQRHLRHEDRWDRARESDE